MTIEGCVREVSPVSRIALYRVATVCLVQCRLCFANLRWCISSPIRKQVAVHSCHWIRKYVVISLYSVANELGARMY